MLKALFGHIVINRLSMLGMVLVTFVCIDAPDVVILKRLASHSTQIMLLFVAVGLFFLIIDQRRLLFTAFGCAAILCLYFKLVADISLSQPVKTSEPSLTVAHLSTSDLASGWQLALKAVIDEQADIITFIELTPDWQKLLETHLQKHYTYHAELTRIDNFGLAIYSRFPITAVDTIYYEEIPTLDALIRLNPDLEVRILTSNTNPPLFRRSFEQLRNQLDAIAQRSLTYQGPTLTTGHYNLDQFSDELQDFRAKANLKDSRKTMSSSLNPPTNHIFYNDFLECLRFQNMYDTVNNRIGIFGEYQLRGTS